MRTFRAWIDPRGGNQDRDHREWCEADLRAFAGVDRGCPHVRMVDVERSSGRILVRLLRRRLYFSVVAFFSPSRGRVLLRIGRRPGTIHGIGRGVRG